MTENRKKEPLTVEKLKTFKGLENLTDEEAQNTLIAIQNFTSILYEYLSEQKRKEQKQEEKTEDNTQFNKAA
jgi:hypothetical protein